MRCLSEHVAAAPRSLLGSRLQLVEDAAALLGRASAPAGHPGGGGRTQQKMQLRPWTGQHTRWPFQRGDCRQLANDRATKAGQHTSWPPQPCSAMAPQRRCWCPEQSCCSVGEFAVGCRLTECSLACPAVLSDVDLVASFEAVTCLAVAVTHCMFSSEPCQLANHSHSQTTSPRQLQGTIMLLVHCQHFLCKQCGKHVVAFTASRTIPLSTSRPAW